MPSKNVADVTMSKAPLTLAKPLPTTVLPLYSVMVSPTASPVPVISMAPPFVGMPFCTKPVGATDCTMADTALDGPLVSVLSTLVSVAVML